MDQNYLIHQLYVRQVLCTNVMQKKEQVWMVLQLSHCTLPQQFEGCSSLIEQVLTDSQGQSEYAIHVKALIARQKGEEEELHHIACPTKRGRTLQSG